MTLAQERQTLANYLTAHGAILDTEYPDTALLWNNDPSEGRLRYVCFRGHYLRNSRRWRVGIGAFDPGHACATVQDPRVSGETDLAMIPTVDAELLSLCRDALALLAL